MSSTRSKWTDLKALRLSEFKALSLLYTAQCRQLLWPKLQSDIGEILLFCTYCRLFLYNVGYV
jgi:hypothetical protein